MCAPAVLLFISAGLVSATAAGVDAPPPPPLDSAVADRVEAVQERLWGKRGSLFLGPEGSFAFNDPFVIRGGGGGRAVYWIRSLVGLSLDVTGWGEAPSEEAIIAQRELRAQIRPAGSSWAALLGVELAPADGKIAALGGILPFELFLRAGAGWAASRNDAGSSTGLGITAGLGLRWFVSSRFGIDTSLTWRTAAVALSLNGALVPVRDSIVSFDLGLPFRLGGGP